MCGHMIGLKAYLDDGRTYQGGVLYTVGTNRVQSPKDWFGVCSMLTII